MHATLIAPEQLLLPLETMVDANLVQHVGAGWRGWATLNRRNDPKQKRLIEMRFPVERMPWVIQEAMRNWGHDHDLYIAQHSYGTSKRSTATLQSLNIAHIDLDIYNTRWIEFNRDQIITAVLKKLDEFAIDHPSYIVWSGRGLQLKWIWKTPVKPKAVPRWQAAQRYIVREVLHDFDADEAAILPTQIMRLVGSRNLQGSEVRIEWVNGGDLLNPVTFEFDSWATQVLPYTREQVHEHYKLMQQYDGWAKQNKRNLELLAEDQPGLLRARASARLAGLEKAAKKLGLSLTTAQNIDMLTAGEIWQRRLNVIQQLLELRGAGVVRVGEKMRHEFIWIAANAYGWVNGKQIQPLKNDLLTWSKQYVPSYTRDAVLSSASAVLKRVTQAQSWGQGLYYMSEPEFIDKIKMTEIERAQLGARKSIESPAQRWDIGSMGFEKMKHLTYEAYCAETTRRMSEAAYRTIDLARAANAEHREKAVLKANEGLTQEEIAQALGVAQGTVSKWTKAGRKTTEMREEARRLDKEEGLTQVEIAKRIGRSQATISRWLQTS